MVVVEHPFEEGTMEATRSNVQILVGILAGAKSCGYKLFLITSSVYFMA